jgi:hypothetical protein
VKFLTILTFCFLTVLSDLTSQNFEEKLLYKTIVEWPENSEITIGILNAIFPNLIPDSTSLHINLKDINFNKNEGKGIDSLLIGSWSGSEKDKERVGLEKHWIQNRSADGTYIILFIEIENGEISSYPSKGKWWVENDVFYEQSSSYILSNAYYYKILNENQVEFKAKDPFYPDYIFIDTKF